jgi:multidrug efflux system membrane fusion protein
MRDTPNPELAGSPTTAAATNRRSVWRWVAIVVVLAAAVVAAWYWWRGSAPPPPSGETQATAPAKKGGRFDPTKMTVPVDPATARSVDMPVRIGALGTVTARSTVTVRARVDGLLERVNFREGQAVRAGEMLAQIDAKPFQVQLQQAQGQLERDGAQLQNARNDLERYRNLLKQDSIAAQQVDNQEALVRQYEATLLSDRATVESARLNLSYTRITAPTSGRAGLRQVDAGNMVHTSDTNGLVVITEVDPIAVTFPIPQDRLPQVMTQLRAGARMPVDAYDRDGRTKLATGTLVTADNVIDTTTGTVKLKAEFPNKDGALFPNQFVNARLLVETLPGSIAVPTSALQRGAPGTFVYVIKDDSTVTVRPVKTGAVDGDLTQVTDGLAAGEHVVADGADKLREGARVEVIDRSAPPRATGGAGGEGKKGLRKKREGGGAPADGASGTAANAPAAAPAPNPPPPQAGQGAKGPAK